jgi:tetratricopeptide (TPR) repeat protein
MADCYNGLAIVGICRGQSADARRYLEQACQLYEEHLRISELSTARVNLVELNHLTGNFKRALELVDQTLAQARATHHREGQAVGLRYRALVLTDLGRTAEAVQNAEEALRRVREIGAEDEMLGIYTVLVRSYLAHEEPENATGWVDIGRELSSEHDLEGYGPILTAWAGHIAAKTGSPEHAMGLIDDALAAQQKGWPHQLTRLNLIAARTLALIDDHDRARTLATEALVSSEACGYRYYALKAHHLLARLAEDESTAHHHERIAKALQRSLAGNLSSDDAKSFNRIIHQTLTGF